MRLAVSGGRNMATLSKVPMSGWTKFNKLVTAFPESAYDTAFDSEFVRSVDSAKNHVLRIMLRIYYKQINPWSVTSQIYRNIATALGVPVPAGGDVGMYRDANEAPRLIAEWSNADWARFLTNVNAQAKLWDSRFWLIPPNDFSLFDIVEGSWVNKSGATTTRLNVKCEFSLQLAFASSYAHQTIEVVNLVDPAGFRSHSLLYDSQDTNLSPNSIPDWQLNNVATNQPTIAHEIGHSLGLPHVGVTRHLAHCTLAQSWGAMLPQSAIPAIYKGGRNANACYGSRATAGDINNIMGAGANFDKDNAQPWLGRLPHHLNLTLPETVTLAANLTRWNISTVDVPPRLINAGV
jgi:hypothetical protein